MLLILMTERGRFRMSHFEHSGMNGSGWDHKLFPFIPSHPQMFNFPYSTIFHYLPFSYPVTFPKEAIFHRFFTFFSNAENGPNGREIIDLNNPGKVKEKERKNQRKQRKGIE